MHRCLRFDLIRRSHRMVSVGDWWTITVELATVQYPPIGRRCYRNRETKHSHEHGCSSEVVALHRLPFGPPVRTFLRRLARLVLYLSLMHELLHQNQENISRSWDTWQARRAEHVARQAYQPTSARRRSAATSHAIWLRFHIGDATVPNLSPSILRNRAGSRGS